MVQYFTLKSLLGSKGQKYASTIILEFSVFSIVEYCCKNQAVLFNNRSFMPQNLP